MDFKINIFISDVEGFDKNLNPCGKYYEEVVFTENANDNYNEQSDDEDSSSQE
jgi:hypothetical protein